MTQTPPETTERITSRQRRIEEQRRKIEAVRADQRRKRFVFGGLGLVAVAALIALVVVFVPKPVAAQGRQVTIEGSRQHIPQGQSITYRNRPPSSGDHYDQPAGYGFFQRDVPTGNWIHDLEHGGIVVLYRSDLCDLPCQQQLQETYSSAPASQLFPGTRKMLVAPYQDMDHGVAVLAWGWVDEMDAPEKDRILAFYRTHVDKGPEQAL